MFLNFGILRPLRRDQKNDWATGGGVAADRAMVGQILGTKADSAVGPGELPWRTNFGSRLHLLRHRNNSPALLAMATAMIVEALTLWAPDLRIVDITHDKTIETERGRMLQLRVLFRRVDSVGSTLLEDEAIVPLPIAV